jgi:hypothetical protein
MSLSVRTEPTAPQKIAGGFVLVPVRQLISIWRACRKAPLGIADFRTWLACQEMVARRCTRTLGDGRSPTYGFAELARLNGVSEKRARASVNRLVGVGLLTWSNEVIEFPEAETDPDDALDDTIGGGKGVLAIPRRMLRLLVGGARPALIATVLAILLRCLSRGRGGFKSLGRVKASWIARVFDVDLRRVKQARKELIDLGWIAAEPTDQWCENRWGRAYTIDLAWDRIATPIGRRLPPPPISGGRRLPPPDSDPEPLLEDKNQEPAFGGPSGVELREGAGERISPTTLPAHSTHLTEVAPAPWAARNLEPVTSPPALVTDEAGTSPPKVETKRPIQPRPAMAADGAGGGSLPAPKLEDVRVEDLKDTGRLLQLHEQAVARDVIGASEADRLRFVAAAEHARAIGTRNVPGLFARLVRSRLWGHLSQDDEDAASRRLKLHLFGSPRGDGPGGSQPAAAGRPRLSADAMLAREVRAALARVGYRGDPFPMVRARDGSWTRERWDAALAELEGLRGGP